MRNKCYLLLILALVSSFFACSKDEDEKTTEPSKETDVIDTLNTSVIMPYSYDMTSEGAEICYRINTKQVSRVEASYKGPSTTEWTNIDVQLTDSLTKVELKDLVSLEYYSVRIMAYNTKGQYFSNIFTFLYDYEVMKVTCFKQPFIVWNSIMENAMQALKDAGNVLESETFVNDEYHLTYLFNYKELMSVYTFSSDKRLKNVQIVLDKKRVSIDELKRFISGAFGYLAYGTIHANIDGNPQVSPLYMTPEGSSYVTIYERNNNYVVDYMDVKDVDVSKVLYR